MSDLEIVRGIKREPICKRKEIDAMTKGKEKNKVLKTYAELLTSFEIGTRNTHR